MLNITSAITAVAQRRQFYWLQPHSAPGGFVGGGPDRCIRLIKRLEQWGVRRFLAIMNYGGLPHGLVMRSMERLAREVMPAFATSTLAAALAAAN